MRAAAGIMPLASGRAWEIQKDRGMNPALLLHALSCDTKTGCS